MIILQATSEAQSFHVNPNIDLTGQHDDITFEFKNAASDVVHTITGSIVLENYYGGVTLTLDFLNAGDEYELSVLEGGVIILKEQVEVLPQGQSAQDFNLSTGQFVQFTGNNETKTIFR